MKSQENYLTHESKHYKMVITKQCLDKIKYLCKQINNIEWSGVLFYSHQGDFNSDLKIIAEDFYLMDIGDAGTTSYDITPDIFNYIAENGLENLHMGLIHSHHNMEAFFSGTDLNTLLTEGSDMNNFVSLIVNNAEKYKAAITRRRNRTGYYLFSNYIESDESNVIEYYELDIINETTEDEKLEARIQEIKNKKKEVIAKPLSLFNFDKDFPIINTKISDSVKSYCLKIVTGSVTLDENSKIDINNYIKNTMEKNFNKTFKTYDDFSMYMMDYINLMIDSFLIDYDTLEEITNFFVNLNSSNPYIDLIIDILKENLNYGRD